jgi:hypothetical protein
MPRVKALKIGEVMELSIDLEPMLYVLGAGQAFARSMKDKTYVDALMDEAFEHADRAFDEQADAVAMTGAISHMYEWGTAGVNKGRSNVRMKPQNPNAKLWTNYSVGTGLDRTIAFVYRPSLATVPKPLASETGMDPEVIASLRPQYFTWKAEVMEENRTVTIAPKEAQWLLLPATKENLERFEWRTNDINRGYILRRGPFEAQPGKERYYGSFTALWDNFWLNTANEIFETDVSRMIEEDYFPEISRPRAPGKMIPAKAWNVRGRIKENESTAKRRATAKRKMKARAAKKKRAR